jgi:hypothetical protein
MKINNKSKVAMNIFHQARRRIALIVGLSGQFADEQISESPNFTFGSSNLVNNQRALTSLKNDLV